MLPKSGFVYTNGMHASLLCSFAFCASYAALAVSCVLTAGRHCLRPGKHSDITGPQTLPHAKMVPRPTHGTHKIQFSACMDADDAKLTCARLCQLRHCCACMCMACNIISHVLQDMFFVFTVCNAGDASSSKSSIVLSTLRLWSGQLKDHFCMSASGEHHAFLVSLSCCCV